MSDTPVSQEKSTDTASLRQYRFDLAVAARRFREVSSALEGRKSSGVTARAGVRVEIDEESQAHHPLVSLQSSSGDSALDQAALTILSNAARITPIPPTLRGKPIAVILRVEFDSHLPSGR